MCLNKRHLFFILLVEHTIHTQKTGRSYGCKHLACIKPVPEIQKSDCGSPEPLM